MSNHGPRHLLVALLALFSAASCSDAHRTLSSPAPGYGFRGTGDPNFHLTPEQRARVRPDFDVNALERLLSMMPAAGRDTLLTFFVRRPPGQPQPLLVEMNEPGLQQVLDEVYAPHYEALSDEELRRLTEMANHGGTELPGRVTVMRRRGLLPQPPEQKPAEEP